MGIILGKTDQPEESGERNPAYRKVCLHRREGERSLFGGPDGPNLLMIGIGLFVILGLIAAIIIYWYFWRKGRGAVAVASKSRAGDVEGSASSKPKSGGGGGPKSGGIVPPPAPLSSKKKKKSPGKSQKQGKSSKRSGHLTAKGAKSQKQGKSQKGKSKKSGGGKSGKKSVKK